MEAIHIHQFTTSILDKKRIFNSLFLFYRLFFILSLKKFRAINTGESATPKRINAGFATEIHIKNFLTFFKKSIAISVHL